jgi:TP901 family phage tail tape measure protein
MADVSKEVRVADVSKEVRVAFEGDDRISKTIEGMNKKFQGFSSSVESATQPLADLTEKLLLAEAAFAALAVAGLAYATAKSFEFESAAIELRKVLGDQPVVLDEARRKALELSNQYGESASDILLSTADFKQAGFDVEESFTLTKAAMDLVIAGSIESSQAAELLVRTLKGFKAPGDEAARIIDILNEVSNNYAVSVEQLGEGMATLSPIAKLMGFSFEETAGILTPVIEIFQSGDEAATALKTGLLKITDTSKPVQEAMEAIGVAQRDQNGELRSGKDILRDVQLAFVGLSDEEKLYYAQQLVGLRQAGKMVEVFDGLSKSTEVTATAMNSAGSAAAEVEARLKAGEVAVNRFKVGFENLAIIIGDQFQESAKEAIEGGIKIENALQEMVDEGSFDPIFDFIGQFASDLGETLSTIAKNLPEAFELVDWDDFLASLDNVIDSVTGLFEAFFGEIDVEKPEDLADALQLVVNGFTALNNVVAGVLEAFKPFVEFISDYIEKILESDEETQKAAGNLLGLATAANKVSGFIGELSGSLDLASKALAFMATKAGIQTIIDLLKGMGTQGTALAAVFGKITVAVAAFGAGWWIGDTFLKDIPIVKSFAESLSNVALSFKGLDEKTIDAYESQATATEEAGKLAVAMVRLADDIDTIPERKATEIELLGEEEFLKKVEDIWYSPEFKEMDEGKDVEIRVSADEEQIQREANKIYEITEEGALIELAVVGTPQAKKDVEDLCSMMPKSS